MGGKEGDRGCAGEIYEMCDGLKKVTPGYLVLQEGGANLLRIEAGRRAARFEERMMRPRNVVLREMFKEVTEGAGWGIEECAEEILGEGRFGM